MNQHFCYYCMSPVNADGSCPVCGLTAGAYQPAPHHIPPGTILMNRYLFGRVLGEGGFGITYIACDLRLDLKVAIKEFFPTDKATRHAPSSLDVTSYTGVASGNYEVSKRKFLSEARTMAKMEKQPEVVSVRDFFEVNNTAYIVMEFVDGTTFRDLVKQEGGKIPTQKLLKTIEPLFDALSAVHAAGLVHRDISPDNLMLEHGKVRLLDFGCAREASHGTNTLTIALKHGYAPIEQYTNHGQGPWTDIYALAATIYFCLTGKPPVRSTDRLLGDELILPSKLGIDLTRQQEQALLRALTIQPRRRFQTMEEFRLALYEESPEPPPPPPAPKPEPKPEPTPKPKSEPKPVPTPEPVPVTAKTTLRNTVELPKPPESKKKSLLLPLLGIAAVVALVISVVIGWNSGSEDVPVAEPFLNADASAVSGQCGNGITWALDLDTGEMVLEGAGMMHDFVAGEGEDLPLSSGRAAPPWAQYRDQIKAVTVSDSISRIGNFAFADCNNLAKLQLGSRTVEVGCSAFSYTALSELQLNDALMLIEDYAFQGTHLERIVLPESLNWLGGGAFQNCPNLKEVTVQGKYTSLNFDTWGNKIFSDENDRIPEDFVLRAYSCSAFEEYARIWDIEFYPIAKGEWEDQGSCGDNLTWYLDLDTGLLKIDGWGHRMTNWRETGIEDKSNKDYPPWTIYREQIRILSIGDDVTRLSEFAFQNCINLVDVHWGKNLGTIETQAFLNSGVDEVVLPESVSYIGQFAFTWCQQLHHVRLPEGLELVHEHSFNRCDNLHEFYVGGQTKFERGDWTPFNQAYEGEQHLPAYVTICAPRGSDAEAYAREKNIPFAVGAKGMLAEHEGQCGDNVYWFVSGDTLVLTGTGETWIYHAPEDPAYYPTGEEEVYRKGLKNGTVFMDAPDFYQYKDQIRYLVVLPGVTVLNHDLFHKMDIEQADLGTIEMIGLGTFSETKLQAITIPRTVTLVRGHSFRDCTELSYVGVIHDKSQAACHFELSVFYNTPELRTVAFGDNIVLHEDQEGDLFCEQTPRDYTPHEDLVFYVVFESYPGSPYRYARERGIQYESFDWNGDFFEDHRTFQA